MRFRRIGCLIAVVLSISAFGGRHLSAHLATFFREAPALNPNVSKISGVVCGVRIEEVEDPLMRKIRYMDKLVDELAKGRPMDKILRA